MTPILMKADKDLFAIYQTIYSDTDIEMWYDWNARLKDTKWTDDCYFIVSNDVKIGGAVVTEDRIMFPFLVPPFRDRIHFWKLLLGLAPKATVKGITGEDIEILPLYGYKSLDIRRLMCRPVDKVSAELPQGIQCRLMEPADMDEVGNVIFNSYDGGIDYELYGEGTLEEVIDDAKAVIDVYTPCNLSIVLSEEATGNIVGVCLAGIGKNYVNGYVEIADICTIPEYRGKGLAKYMIAKVIHDSMGRAPFLKLAVTVGNPVEHLYRSMGFYAGPRFANFMRR